MPWKESGVVEERMRFVRDFECEEMTMAELCRFYGIARKTGYEMLERWREQGAERTTVRIAERERIDALPVARFHGLSDRAFDLVCGKSTIGGLNSVDRFPGIDVPLGSSDD